MIPDLLLQNDVKLLESLKSGLKSRFPDSTPSFEFDWGGDESELVHLLDSYGRVKTVLADVSDGSKFGNLLIEVLGRNITERINSLAGKKRTGASYHFEEELAAQQDAGGALIKTSIMLKSLETGEGLNQLISNYLGKNLTEEEMRLEFTPTEPEWLRRVGAAFPEVPSTSPIYEYEFFTRGLYNQWREGITNAQADEWFRELYERLEQKAKSAGSSSFHSNERLVKAYTDQERAQNLLFNTLDNVYNTDELKKDSRILVIGIGRGMVELGAIKRLQENGAMTGEVVAIDPLPQNIEDTNLTFIQKDLIAYTEENPEEKFDLIISIGSGPHNDYSLHDWTNLVKAMKQVSNEGAVVIMEAGAIDPEGIVNKRNALAKDYNISHARMIYGLYGPIASHRIDENIPEDRPAVIMFPTLIYKLFASFTGGVMLNEPFKDPVDELALTFRLQGDEYLNLLAESSFSKTQNALSDPYWVVGEKNDIRGMWVWKESKRDSPWINLLDELERVAQPHFS